MNERLEQLYIQAHDQYFSNEAAWEKFDPEKFAELIVKECIYTLQRKVVRNGNTPENQRSREHIRDLGEKFGITFPMDYYPDKD